MNKVFTALLLSMILFLAACQKEYNKAYDLSLDAHSYAISSTGESFHVYVYCSGEWKAELSDKQQTWIRIQPGTEQGRGVGLVRLEADHNNVGKRNIELWIRSGQFRDTVKITQSQATTLDVIL